MRTAVLSLLCVVGCIVLVGVAPAAYAQGTSTPTTSEDVFLQYGPVGAAAVVEAGVIALLFWQGHNERKEAQKRADDKEKEHKAELAAERTDRNRERERHETTMRELTGKVVEGQAKQTAVLGDVTAVMRSVMDVLPLVARSMERFEDSQRHPTSRGGR